MRNVIREPRGKNSRLDYDYIIAASSDEKSRRRSEFVSKAGIDTAHVDT